MKLKRFSFALLFVMCCFSLLSFGDVNASTDVPGRTYYSTLQMSDGDAMIGQERLFYTGAHSIQISFDRWNSSICTSSNDDSYVVINLYDNVNRRTLAVENMASHLYTCNTLNFGTYSRSYYIYKFGTMKQGGGSYCGFKSNSVIMKSRA